MREKLAAALKQAQEAGEKRRIATLRLIQTAIKDRDQAAKETGRDAVADDEVIDILEKMVRQREESAHEFEESGQLDRAEEERTESAIISEFLPEQYDEAEVRSICEDTLREINAHGLRDLGRCMSELKERYPGKMNFARASCVVRDLLRDSGSGRKGAEAEGSDQGT